MRKAASRAAGRSPFIPVDGDSVDRLCPGDAGGLARLLLELSGGQVMLADPEPHRGELLARGREFAADGLVMRRGEPHRCHGNAARLWYDSGGSIAVATGYAFTRGLWVQHSWGVEAGRVIETTCQFDRYFGVELATRESLGFAFANASDLCETIARDLAEGRGSPNILREIRSIAGSE